MRDELARQLTRRRTRLVLALMVAIPLALVAIYVVRGAPELDPGATPSLQQLANGSALAFTTFVLYLCAPLLLVAVAALFAGDSVASEAAWGTLRYLLAAPIARRRLLARKLVTAVLLTALALALLVATSLVAGLVAFGWHPLDTPVGGIIDTGAASCRLLLTCAYVLITLLPFAALALWFSTLSDAPLAPVAGAVGVAVVAQILDVLPTLGRIRAALPTHYAYDWLDLYVDPPSGTDMSAGVLQSTIITVLALATAWWSFARRDINS